MQYLDRGLHSQIQVINATPQKRHLAYKNPQKRREETPPFSLGWLNVYTFGFRPKKQEMAHLTLE